MDEDLCTPVCVSSAILSIVDVLTLPGDNERREMSQALMLVATESEQTLSGLLTNLDAESLQNAPQSHFEKGPFSAFRLSDNQPSATPELNEDRQSTPAISRDDVDSSPSLEAIEYLWINSLPGLIIENDAEMQTV
jgi:hypothetical protein